MDDSIRKMASVERISSVEDHKNADRLEVCKILGWQVVTRKGEFKKNDLCVFFEIDSIIPKMPWSEFLADKNRPDKPIRLKTSKLRTVISQGLAMPLSILEGLAMPLELTNDKRIVQTSYEEGDDVTEILGVTKYEPVISAQLAGIMRGNFPSFLRKTDSHRVQAHPRVIQEMQGLDCYVTIKVEGTSSTFYNKDGEYGVCSRRIDLIEDENNTYWKMSHKYELDKVLKDTDYAIQAETFGPSIEDNVLGMKEVEIQVFDVFDIKAGEYLDYSALKGFCETFKLPMVEVVYEGPFKWQSVDELIEFASAQKYPNGAFVEGIVIRPQIGRYSEVLQGRMAFKVISPEYLIEHGGR